jgi:hypothetical protein
MTETVLVPSVALLIQLLNGTSICQVTNKFVTRRQRPSGAGWWRFAQVSVLNNYIK